MTGQPIKIDTSAKVPKPKNSHSYIIWLAAFAVLCYLASIFALFPAFVRKKQNPEVPQNDPTATLQMADDAPADESQLQWVSPTSGPPITLEYVPPGTQAVFHLRPSELLAHDEGKKILAALGPWGERRIAALESEIGSKFDEVESLLVAIYRDADHLDVAMRAVRSRSWSEEELQKLLAAMPAVDRTVFLPKSGQGRVLVSCSGSAVAEIERRGTDPPLLARDLERLLPFTDQQRSASLLMPMKFLETAGPEMLDNGGKKVIAAFDALIPDNASAVLLSCDWRKDFFCELAATIVQNAPPHRFNREFATQLATAADQMARLLAANSPSFYGHSVETRFPAMLRTTSHFTRLSHEGGIAVARTYLPVQAGHNLLLASRLALRESSQATETAQPTLSLSDRLRQMTTLSFPKETLENALKMLAADTQLPIQIAGRDLQLEGITRNQTFGLEVRDRPAAEVLVEVLRQANPDRDSTGPGDPRQKLVYVVRDDVVVITTRVAAGQRGEKLPDVFSIEEP